MCGEHRSIVGIGVACQGSSPHVRGALKCGFAAVPGLRIIPACAGSTGVVLMRFFPNGIIPACAGSTKRFSSTEMPFRDHPRMCGEHFIRLAYCNAFSGSSPHVRGAHDVLRLSAVNPGIIPACAGSTPGHGRGWACGRDHPRMCGEHALANSLMVMPLGSSPHVRGALEYRQRVFKRRGIIPACAGSTPSRISADSSSRDHPRMCGEHNMQEMGRACGRGSSPHVRGALTATFRPVDDLGIIPACAGSTAFQANDKVVFRDHPRMCGEHAALNVEALAAAGSSPHVRGAPWLGTSVSRSWRIIPACAGSTRAI